MLKMTNCFTMAFLVLFFVAAPFEVNTQTTIFNIPTADTQPRGTWNVEADLVTKPIRYSNGGYQTLGYRLAYGLNHKTEIGTNFYYTWDGRASTGQAEFSVKRKVYQSEKHGFSMTVGTVFFVPVKNITGDRTSAIVYSNVRKTINPLGGMTVTGGAYHVFRGGKEFGTRTAAIVELVQPINRRFSFVADWFTGHNRFGYASAGLNVNITRRQYLLAGYSFGNSGRGNNALAAYYGFTF
jgi:hypothetical protein